MKQLLGTIPWPGLPMSSTTAELVKSRLEHLWKIINGISPSDNREAGRLWYLTGYRCRNFNGFRSELVFRLALDNDVRLGISFYSRVCRCCFSFWLFGHNCTVSYETHRRAKLKFKKRLWMSEIVGRQNSGNDSLTAPLMAVLCHVCDNATIFDTTPVNLSSQESSLQNSGVPLQASRTKVNELKRTLERSLPADPKPSASMDLESFLSGFL